nr:MAG: hypothetical protein [Lokiarchaeota virus Ratatoskr Meg22_1012]
MIFFIVKGNDIFKLESEEEFTSFLKKQKRGVCLDIHVCAYKVKWIKKE